MTCVSTQDCHTVDESVVPTGFRKRQRDGKIVKKSPLHYHVYKLARSELKNNDIYYISMFEDKPPLDISHVTAWVQVRIYQCRWFAERLSSHRFISDEVNSKINNVIISVCTWIDNHKHQAKAFSMSSAGAWVAILALHYLAAPLSTRWAFERQELVERFTPSNLWDLFDTAPESEKRVAVCALPYDLVVRHQNECEEFGTLLDTIRECNTAFADFEIPKLLPGVSSLTPPLRIVHSQSGMEMPLL